MRGRDARRALALLAAAGLGACRAPAPRAPEGPELARALASVSPERLLDDARWLADEERGGRDTPSPGLEQAADYLIARLESLGWRPGTRDGWRQTYPLWRATPDAGRCRIVLEDGAGEELVLALERDYAFRPDELFEHAREGPLVFGGLGARGDLAKVDLTGRWALCVQGDLSWSRRAYYVRRSQALGLVVMPDPWGSAESAGEEPPAWARGASEELVLWPPDPADAAEGFPTVYLDPDAARRLVDAAGAADRRPQPGRELGLTLREERRLLGRVDVANVCALWPGSDPALAHEAVLVCAHYDHVGRRDDALHPGADDNASGSAALLAVAEALAIRGPLRRPVLLAWFSGEERGLYGARAWCVDPRLPEGVGVAAAINLDMVGRNAPAYLELTPSPRHTEHGDLARRAHALAPLEGFHPADGDAGWSRSDHFALHRLLDLPVVALSTGEHEDYHAPTDTPDKLDADKMARVSRLVLRLLDSLDAPTGP